jgi:hypothetical protein
MGLDMYLKADFYFPAVIQRGGSPSDTKTFHHPIIGSALDAMGLTKPVRTDFGINDPDFYGSSLQIPLGYWRKASAIHAWFIRNQEQDDCKPIDVGIEELKELRTTCQQILEAGVHPDRLRLADELLPSRAGFFFGPTNLLDPEVWAWYLEYLRITVGTVERAIALDCWCTAQNDVLGPSNDNRYSLGFQYYASW